MNKMLSEVLSLVLTLEKRAQENREECRKHGNELMADQYRGRATTYDEAAGRIRQALTQETERDDEEWLS